MGLAAQYFGERDSNSRLDINSAQGLWEWVNAGGADRLASRKWPLVPGEDLFFRGQPNTEYSLSSSLYRVCRARPAAPEVGTPNRVDERVMAGTEREVIGTMRREGIGRRMTDGQLLAVLQHHGIPTRLIDVSESPLEALFFAVDQEHGADGRLFMLHLHRNAAEQVDTIDFSQDALDWADATHGQRRARADWTQQVAIVDQTPLDPRMQAQRGRFLVGGLNRRYGGRSYRIDRLNIPAEQYPDISTLGVNFLNSFMGKPNLNWPATGWTLRVRSQWKPELLERLAVKGIDRDSMYPPLAEVRRLALKVARDAVDTLTDASSS
ncbi:FRG domain-containing protein [Streptomyces phaeochromogenes]|uniref:FRG domain-containing protein n=1 Tax=Streptomyces phaeochromogenes TaxID=1923 RepID=UPI002E2BCFC1|nr:FRG domain-containing protein [Streptomyces phaeochromogenes]